MEGVALREAIAIYDVVLHARRVLHHDGTTRLAVSLKHAAEGDVVISRHLVAVEASSHREDVGAVEVVAAKHDFVTRVSDGQLLYVLDVVLVGGEPIFTVEEPKPWKMPCPRPSTSTTTTTAVERGWCAATTVPTVAKVQTKAKQEPMPLGAIERGWRATMTQTIPRPPLPLPPPIPAAPAKAATADVETAFELRSDEIELAAEFSTFDTVKSLLVMPLTIDTGRSYAQLLGAPLLKSNYSASMERAEDKPKEIASRRATHFFSWSFSQQFGRYVAAYRSFIADNGLDANRVYTWISPLSEDQYGASDFKKEEWANIFEKRLHDIGHLVLLFSPWDDAAPLGRIWCLWELFVSSISDNVAITVQLPPPDEDALTSALVDSTISVSMLLKGISTRNADARDPEAKAMIVKRIKAHGGYDAVDTVIREELMHALVREARTGAVSAASRSELRAIVLTEGQTTLVDSLFKDESSKGIWRHGRWHLNVPASSGKSYIAVHLVGQWATARDGGPTLYLCHHARMQRHVCEQVKLELRKELEVGVAKLVLRNEFNEVRDATWVIVDGIKVLVATIDGAMHLAVVDVLAHVFGGRRDISQRIAGFLRRGEVDLGREGLGIEGAAVREAGKRRANEEWVAYCRGPRPFATCDVGHSLLECDTRTAENVECAICQDDILAHTLFFQCGDRSCGVGDAGNGLVLCASCQANEVDWGTFEEEEEEEEEEALELAVGDYPWRDYARLCFVCATSRRWHGRFGSGGVVVDEGQLVCGREARLCVAGQHLVPAEAVHVVLEWWANANVGDESDIGAASGGRLAVLGDMNQLNLDPHNSDESGAFPAWPITPPIYPSNCADIGADAEVLLQTNLRNPHSVRDASALFYNEFARDGTLQLLHPDSAEGRALETVDVRMSGWSGTTCCRGSKIMHCAAEDYAVGVASALTALYNELRSKAESAVLDRPMVAVLTPHDHIMWGGLHPAGWGVGDESDDDEDGYSYGEDEEGDEEEGDEEEGEEEEEDEDVKAYREATSTATRIRQAHRRQVRTDAELAELATRVSAWEAANRSFRERLRAATVAQLRAAAVEGNQDAADVATAVLAVHPSWLIWECVENFVGLDIPLVVMAGFDPLGARNEEVDVSYSQVVERSPLAYMAMTRATHGTVVVEPNAARFARHYDIRADGEGGFIATSADESAPEMVIVVDSDGQLRLFSTCIDYMGTMITEILSEIPKQVFDPLRSSSLRKLNISYNFITRLPDQIGSLTGLKRLDMVANRVTTLPDAICALTGLEHLSLEDNQLAIPQSPVVEAWLAELRSNGCVGAEIGYQHGPDHPMYYDPALSEEENRIEF